MDDHDEEEQNFLPLLRWERPYFYWGEDVFIPKIWDGPLNQPIPTEFNSVTISLFGGLKADLNWNEPRIQAHDFVQKGYRIFWDIDLGLFFDLSKPLINQTQYLSLGLSLEHFRNTLWKEFHEDTIGLCLYRGKATFSDQLMWNEELEGNFQAWILDQFRTADLFRKETGISFSEISKVNLQNDVLGKKILEQFCQNAAVEYLNLLLGFLPDALQPFLLLELSDANHAGDYALWLHPERYARFNVILKDSLIPSNGLVWEDGESWSGFISTRAVPILSAPFSTVGICLPSMLQLHPPLYTKLNEVLIWLNENHIPYRIVADAFLTNEWDGLDDLIVFSKSVTTQVKRKLQGFCAAGGSVITMDERSLGLSNERSLLQFFQK